MKSDVSSGIYIFKNIIFIIFHSLFTYLLEYNKKKRNLSSDDSSLSSDTDDKNGFSKFGTYSKAEQYDGASCSRSVDSDSNISESDDLFTKPNQNVENNEKSGNKGMSLMVNKYLQSV